MRLLEEKCAMIADVFDLPVVFFQKNNEILFEIKKENLYNPFISVEDEPFHSAKIMNQYVEILRIRKSNFLEKFILLSVSKHDEFLGTLIKIGRASCRGREQVAECERGMKKGTWERT